MINKKQLFDQQVRSMSLKFNRECKHPGNDMIPSAASYLYNSKYRLVKELESIHKRNSFCKNLSGLKDESCESDSINNFFDDCIGPRISSHLTCSCMMPFFARFGAKTLTWENVSVFCRSKYGFTPVTQKSPVSDPSTKVSSQSWNPEYASSLIDDRILKTASMRNNLQCFLMQDNLADADTAVKTDGNLSPLSVNACNFNRTVSFLVLDATVHGLLTDSLGVDCSAVEGSDCACAVVMDLSREWRHVVRRPSVKDMDDALASYFEGNLSTTLVSNDYYNSPQRIETENLHEKNTVESSESVQLLPGNPGNFSSPVPKSSNETTHQKKASSLGSRHLLSDHSSGNSQLRQGTRILVRELTSNTYLNFTHAPGTIQCLKISKLYCASSLLLIA